MNILIITHIYPPAIDGGSKVIAKAGEYLSKSGHSITVLTSNCKSTDDFVNPKSVSIPLNSIDQQLNVYRLPVYKNLRRPLKLINLFIPKNTYLWDLISVFQKGPIFKFIPFIKTLFILKPQKFDLIICGPLPTTICLYANFLKKVLKTKLLINSSFHQTDQDFLKKPLTRTLRNADYLWTLTNFEQKYFVKNLKINLKNIILAGNGIDSDLLINPNLIKFPSSPKILFIGSLSQHKRVDLIIKAFSEISKDYPKMNLVIAGQKTLYYPTIKSVYSKIDITIKKRIKFHFNFPSSKLVKLIDQSSILVLPSIQESFGLVLLEAWARGKPVIVSNIPPLKELVQKTNGGLCFKTDSLIDLELKIAKLLSNSNLCQELGKNGLKYVKNNYTWDQVTNKICQKL